MQHPHPRTPHPLSCWPLLGRCCRCPPHPPVPPAKLQGTQMHLGAEGKSLWNWAARTCVGETAGLTALPPPPLASSGEDLGLPWEGWGEAWGHVSNPGRSNIKASKVVNRSCGGSGCPSFGSWRCTDTFQASGPPLGAGAEAGRPPPLSEKSAAPSSSLSRSKRSLNSTLSSSFLSSSFRRFISGKFKSSSWKAPEQEQQVRLYREPQVRS